MRVKNIFTLGHFDVYRVELLGVIETEALQIRDNAELIAAKHSPI
jgi:hypothetical protein